MAKISVTNPEQQLSALFTFIYMCLSVPSDELPDRPKSNVRSIAFNDPFGFRNAGAVEIINPRFTPPQTERKVHQRRTEIHQNLLPRSKPASAFGSALISICPSFARLAVKALLAI
jgi:hypothetical protein